jgi:hypothetical protein
VVQLGYEEDAQERMLAQIQGLEEGEAPHVRETIIELDDQDDILNQYSTDGGDEAISTGKWTMIIHEGMMGFIHDAEIDQKITFLTFWRHNRIEDVSDAYESICYETMVGQYHTVNPENEEEEQWGCFFARKEEVTDEERNPDDHKIFRDGMPSLGATSGNSR